MVIFGILVISAINLVLKVFPLGNSLVFRIRIEKSVYFNRTKRKTLNFPLIAGDYLYGFS